jgi:MFS family permease
LVNSRFLALVYLILTHSNFCLVQRTVPFTKEPDSLFMDFPISARHRPIRQGLSEFFSNPLARSVGFVFALDSFLFGSWVARIPHVKYSLELNDAQLGLALFALPIGSIAMNPFTGRLIRRFGSARCSLWGGIGFFLSVLLPINSYDVFLLTGGLFVMGLFTALLNVAMNTCAANLEKAQGIRIMSTCHGMWSLGGMLGSTFAGLLIWLAVPASIHMMGVVLVLIIIMFFLQKFLLAIHEEASPHSVSLARPTQALMILIAIGIAVSMAEGLAFDWSAVYLREIAHSTASVSALGFAVFSLAMTAGRFMGDSIIPRFGQKRLLGFGGLLGGIGILIAVLIPEPAAVMIGFLVLGLGCSLGAPMLYTASMQLPGTSPAAGLATFATLSFIGFMAGPPLVGFIAEGYGLPYGLLFVALLLGGSGLLSRWARL